MAGFYEHSGVISKSPDTSGWYSMGISWASFIKALTLSVNDARSIRLKLMVSFSLASSNKPILVSSNDGFS